MSLRRAGEHGTDDPVSWPPNRLAELRSRELTTALGMLGVVEHHWLDYEDGTLPEVDADVAVGQICALIELVRPDTIVTFGPEGMTGHADHRVVAAWTLAAWQAVASDARLLQATTTAGYAQRFARMSTEILIFADGLPLRTPETDLALRLHLRGLLLDRKVAALRAQASQTDGVVDAMGLDTYRSWVSEEAFVEPVTVAGDLRCGPRSIPVPFGT